MLHSHGHLQTELTLNGARRDVDVYDAVWFEALFEAMDRLHDCMSDLSATKVTPIDLADMVGWLEDIIYTAQETIVEIRENYPETGVTTIRRSACN